MARHGLLSPAGAKVVAGLILNYTLPALLFAKMVTCVTPDNIKELGFVALVAICYIAMGAVLGFLIQRTGMVPKRLYWGIVAATMFTNFGDLPISIILAVSDHPPFLVGDGARGTAYSSVFISVFYLFLFPLGGYRLIRYDHVKESKRLQNLTKTLQEHPQHPLELSLMRPSSNPSETTLADDGMSPHATPVQRQHRHHQQQQQKQNIPSPVAQHQYLRQHDQGLQSTFSATSTMISMDYRMEENVKELQYRPQDQDTWNSGEDTTMSTSPRCQPEEESPSMHPRTLVSGHNSDRSSPTVLPHHRHAHVLTSHPLQALRCEVPRYSVESVASNGTGATRFSIGLHEDDQILITPMTKAVTAGPGTGSKKSLRSPLSNGYQPPPLRQHQQPYTLNGLPGSSSSSANSSRSNSLTPLDAVSPTLACGHHGQTSSLSPTATGKAGMHQGTETMATVPLDQPSLSASSDPAAVAAVAAATEGMPTEPLPKVPPQLQNAYKSKHQQGVHWFWRVFHGTREYLTPPTIGLIFGLLAALTPLRGLFVPTATPFPSPDELPPLSFILEVTLMLGGCCVPLGLTVLGASLSRLKPGRMRPLIPVMTMITVAKMVISPLVGILLVQLVLVRHYGWVSGQNHMLQFTLMLMSGSPTSITCFVLAQVWDRRTKNAGSEMAALIAVQYAVATVLLTIGSACMMYFLF
ncbi:Protein M3 [Mortierella claussenii]|nr:Protein M3 [Mortierella claussenii]